ncbi:MAG: NAD-dependent DNA ligase LigA [Candidatus Omnitrophica bacterium]|nr:NAD-dependent DNA ligase LigA [Candidatus Omnitrophota bacterium]
MASSSIKKEIISLREQIIHHNRCYYELNDPEISDKEYDSLLIRLKELETKYPEFFAPTSPTNLIGRDSANLSVKHKQPVLSLDNSYSIDDLRRWQSKTQRLLKLKSDQMIEYFVELKIDGVSVVLSYEKGKLTVGATRGDGTIGENVTANVLTIKTVPKILTGTVSRKIEFRGEVYIDKADFEKMNKERLQRGQSIFANPRNAASGSLKLLDIEEVRKRKLKCFIHSFGFIEDTTFSSQKEFLEKAKKMGFSLNPHSKYCSDIEEVIAFCQYWQSGRDLLEYDVDGVVVKVNSFSYQHRLGLTAKSPRWAIAYKFPAQQATTRISAIRSSVGRTGIITPVADLVPVECGGVVISKATLHNFEEIKRLDVRVDDTVLIERAGEVIPKIVKVILTKRKGNPNPALIPEVCPVCQGVVAKEKEAEVYYYCINPNCPAQLKRSLLHFASRAAMDIEGLGTVLVDELVNRKSLKSLVDIYRLSRRDLLNLPLVKDKKADNLMLAIKKSKTQGLARFIYGLGIRHVGEKAARTLAASYQDIWQFFDLDVERLKQVDDIGGVIAQSIVKFFSSPKTQEMIEGFKGAGLVLSYSNPNLKDSSLSGKIFIFTGKLDEFSRDQARNAVLNKGGQWVNALSKNVDFVVVGRDPGSKYKKAIDLGLRIVNESEFRKIIDE